MSFLWSFGAKKEPAAPTSPLAPSQSTFKTMSSTFRKGVQYNMKIVLRGDVMTGKSNLFQRLQGLEFDENYTSTPQIEVANIPWNYRDSPDIVKIEVWDVVDKAHNSNKGKETQGIKLEHNASTPAQQDQQPPTPPPKDTENDQKDNTKEDEDTMGLDAATVNVYRNTHGAILLFDTTKPWTFEYVNRELPNIPESLSVLVIGNFCDKAEERKVDISTIHATLYKHNQNRIEKGAIKPNLIRYAETSMKTGQGLQYIHEYLGVPYLQLVIESLNKQLELKAVEIVDLLEDLDINEDVPELLHRRRGQDNFVQPTSDDKLSLSHNELKANWDQEDIEAIAADHPNELETFPRQQTPPVPTEPVKSTEAKDWTLKTEEVPAVNVGGEDKIADEWFSEENTASATSTTSKQAYNGEDEEDDQAGNPMVQTDEDVEPIAYDETANSEAKHIDEDTKPGEIANKPAQQQEEQHEEEVATPAMTYQSSVYKSELTDVWSGSRSELRRISNTEIASGSEDEDNRISNTTADTSVDEPTASPAAFGAYGYEEIGGSNEENPWSAGKQYELEETVDKDKSVAADTVNEKGEKTVIADETAVTITDEPQDGQIDEEIDAQKETGQEQQPAKRTNNNSRKKRSGKKNRKRRN